MCAEPWGERTYRKRKKEEKAPWPTGDLGGNLVGVLGEALRGQKKRPRVIPMTQRMYKPHEVQWMRGQHPRQMQGAQKTAGDTWQDELRKTALKHAADRAKKADEEQVTIAKEQRDQQRKDQDAVRKRVFALQDKLSSAKTETERAAIGKQLAELGAAPPPPEVTTEDIAAVKEAEALKRAEDIGEIQTDTEIQEIKQKELELNREYDRLSQDPNVDPVAKQAIWDEMQATGLKYRETLESKLAQIAEDSPPILREYDKKIRSIRNASDEAVKIMSSAGDDPDAYEDMWVELGELNRQQRDLSAQKREIEQKIARGEEIGETLKRFRALQEQQARIREERMLEDEQRRTELLKTEQEQRDILYPEEKARREAAEAGMVAGVTAEAREAAKEPYHIEAEKRAVKRTKEAEERAEFTWLAKEEYKKILAGEKADEAFINSLLLKEHGMRTDEEWEWTEQVRTLRAELKSAETILRDVAKGYSKEEDEYKNAEDKVTLARTDLKYKETRKPEKEPADEYIKRRKKLLKREIEAEKKSGTPAETLEDIKSQIRAKMGTGAK